MSNDIFEDVFRHHPLDHDEASLRLVEILFDPSSDGLIQCRMFHTTNPPRPLEENVEKAIGFDDSLREPFPKYTCLSYAWGRPDRGFPIRINGKRFRVRGNLLHFLEVARTEFSNQRFWIDALCIDQENTAERNHQVQQMGSIFSQAEEVLIWLGKKPELESVIQEVNLAYRDAPPSNRRNRNVYDEYDYLFFGSKRSSARDAQVNLAGPYAVFCNDEYWSRAWVTQEIVLAKRAVVIAGANNIELDLLTRKATMPDTPFHYVAEFVLDRTAQRDDPWRNALTDSWGVINLLHHFRSRACAIPRDRIYSLLALSEEGKTLEVAYDVSDEAVMRQALQVWEQSLCLCSAAIIAQALWPHKFELPDLTEEDKPFVEMKIPASRLKHSIAQTVIITKCSFCSDSVSPKFFQTRGVVLCLKEACSDVRGHLFWQGSRGKKGQFRSGKLYMENWHAGGYNWRLVCEGEVGAKVEMVERNGVSIALTALRLTFQALVDIVKDGLAPVSLSSRLCPNLWHSARDPTRPDARRRSLKIVKAERA